MQDDSRSYLAADSDAEAAEWVQVIGLALKRNAELQAREKAGEYYANVLFSASAIDLTAAMNESSSSGSSSDSGSSPLGTVRCRGGVVSRFDRGKLGKFVRTTFLVHIDVVVW